MNEIVSSNPTLYPYDSRLQHLKVNWGISKFSRTFHESGPNMFGEGVSYTFVACSHMTLATFEYFACEVYVQ